jgi:serine phosphatase RsbU (regulator of sigma subunit)
MKNNHKISFLFILFSLFLSLGEGWGGTLFAQNKNIDSLLILLKNDQPDTNKVNHLNDLGWALMNQNPDTAIFLGNQASTIIEKLLYLPKNVQRTFLAKTYSNLGIYYSLKDDNPRAIDFCRKAIKLNEELGNNKNLVKNFSNMGIAYMQQGAFPEALAYSFRSLKMAQKFGMKKTIAVQISTIGSIYMEQGNYVLALEHSLKALRIKEELGDKKGISFTLANIGNIYFGLGNYNRSLEYNFRAFQIAKEFENKVLMAQIFTNIASIYIKQKKYKNAYDSLYTVFPIYFILDSKSGEQYLYLTLSELYESSNVPLLDTIGGKLLNMEQMRLRSIYYFKRAVEIEDLIFNDEFKKQMELKEVTNEFDKKEEIVKAQIRKQQAVEEAKNQKQTMITLFVAFGFLLVMFFAGFIFRSLRITRKQKQLIESKRAETEIQKKIIEEKNKDITDSIHYAKRIQDALLREETHVSMHLPEHFILFLPKDIVSGDFYWGAEKQQYWYFAAVDCTGHGVPGAVMSMLSISFLNDIISSKELLSPAEILNRLRDKVIKELRQTGEEGGSKDGMDISLCRLNLKTNELQWAGANNALNLIRNGKLEEIKADKQPIGYYPESRPFTNHEIQLQKGDSIYIYSDGYADQFGGPKGKKFKYKQLEDLILANNLLLMKDQKEIFKKNFLQWKGSLEQVDDVCLFGVRV